MRDALDAYDKKHGALAPVKPPPGPTVDKKGRTIKPPPLKEPPFEGTPIFEHHKVLIGEVVTDADDVKGTLDVRVGTITGTVRVADYERYNPQDLAASAFAPTGSLVRVSLLAPAPLDPTIERAAAPRVRARRRARRRRRAHARDRGARRQLRIGRRAASIARRKSRRQPGSTFKPIVYSYALHARRFTPATLIDPKPDTFPAGTTRATTKVTREPTCCACARRSRTR